MLSIYLMIRVGKQYWAFGFGIKGEHTDGLWYELYLGPRCLRLMTPNPKWEWSRYF